MVIAIKFYFYKILKTILIKLKLKKDEKKSGFIY